MRDTPENPLDATTASAQCKFEAGHRGRVEGEALIRAGRKGEVDRPRMQRLRGTTIRVQVRVVAVCAAVAGMLLAGCSDRVAPQPAATAAAGRESVAPLASDGGAAGKPRTTAPDAAVSDPYALGMVASTNEPFWQAAVGNGTVVLTGAGVPTRTMAIVSSTRDGDARVVVAADADGRIEVRVSPTACEDDMSGAAFPATAALTVDGGGLYRGCARAGPAPRWRECGRYPGHSRHVPRPLGC